MYHDDMGHTQSLGPDDLGYTVNRALLGYM